MSTTEPKVKAAEEVLTALDIRKATKANWPWDFDIIPLRMMFTDEYQRPLSRFWKTIRDQFNPFLLQSFTVSKRSDTSYALIDGQSRKTAMDALGHMNAPCNIYEGLTRKEEAWLFAMFQSERKNVTALEKFNAFVVAEEPKMIEIKKRVEAQGFVIEKSNVGNAITAVKALQDIYDLYSPDFLEMTLDIIRKAWNHQHSGSNSNEMLRGIAYFLWTHDDIDDDKLVRGLQTTEPGILKAKSGQLRAARGIAGIAPGQMAEVLQASYERKTLEVKSPE